MSVARSMGTCPLTWWASTYVVAIPLCDLALRSMVPLDRGNTFPFALVATLVSSVAGAVVLELLVRRVDQCGVAHHGYQRAALYGLSVIVGLFVAYPGLSVARNTVPVFRMVGAVGLIGLLGALGWHRSVDHAVEPISLSGSRRMLLYAGRLPFALLAIVAVVLIFIAVGEMVYSVRAQ